MDLFLDNLGKRYREDWIFRGVSTRFEGPGAVAILGPNGSGKSTLMRLLAGLATPSEGRVHRMLDADKEAAETDLAVCSFTAPYLDLPEELTIRQLIEFHFDFRCIRDNVRISDVPGILLLDRFTDLEVQSCSSGMRQRLKVGLAFLTDAPFLFLDEPLTNLDVEGNEWYGNMYRRYAMDRLVFVASNRVEEYAFCRMSIHMHQLPTRML